MTLLKSTYESPIVGAETVTWSINKSKPIVLSTKKLSCRSSFDWQTIPLLMVAFRLAHILYMLFELQVLVYSLIDWCFTARQHKIGQSDVQYLDGVCEWPATFKPFSGSASALDCCAAPRISLSEITGLRKSYGFNKRDTYRSGTRSPGAYCASARSKLTSN